MSEDDKWVILDDLDDPTAEGIMLTLDKDGIARKVELSPSKLSAYDQHLFDIIDAYKAGENVKDAVTSKINGEYNKLRDYAYEFVDGEVNSVLTTIENIWCEERFEKVEPYIHKDGSWKRRTLLPKGYSSAKSVILKAKDLGILNKSLGKSALERAIRERVSGAIATASVPDIIKEEFFRFERNLMSILGSPMSEAELRLTIEHTESLLKHLESLIGI